MDIAAVLCVNFDVG